MNSIKSTKAVLLLIFTLTMAVNVQAQDYATVKGIVTDSITGEIMPIVKVYLMQNDSIIAQYSTMTDFDGIYRIPYVRFGKYTLVVESFPLPQKESYPLPQKKTIIDIVNSGTHVFDIQLSIDPLVPSVGCSLPWYLQDPDPTQGAPPIKEHSYQSLEDIQNSYIRSYGPPYYGTGTIEVEHKGNLLIVVEPEETEL